MKLKDIINKIVAGEELSAEEKDFLGKADVDGENRIPKSRLDEEIAKRKQAEEASKGLQDSLTALESKVEELENSGKSEVEKAKIASDKELATLRKELGVLKAGKEEAEAKIAKSERQAKIAELAQNHNFSNSKYLDFLIAEQGLDLNDADKTGEYLKGLSQSQPELFKSTAKSGGGTGGSGGAGSTAKNRLDELMKKPTLSQREASEVIELQEEITSGNNGE